MLHDGLPCAQRICSEPATLVTPTTSDGIVGQEEAFPYTRSCTSGGAPEELCPLMEPSFGEPQPLSEESGLALPSPEYLPRPAEEDTTIDDLLDQLLKISRHSPPGSQAESSESLRSGVAAAVSPGTLDYTSTGSPPEGTYGQQFLLPQEWHGRIAYESAELMAQFNSGTEMDLTRAEGHLNPEEEQGGFTLRSW